MADVAIVGGGLIGAAIAWRSALAGLQVTLIDDARRTRASWAAAGMLAPVAEVSYGEEPLLSLSLRSAERYPAFVDELQATTGLDVGYRSCGSLLVAVDSDDFASLMALYDFQQRLGLAVEQLSIRQTRALEPSLTPALRGGILVNGDHQVDNRRLLAALHVGAAAAGAVVETSTAELRIVGDRVVGVSLADGRVINAGTVVLCGGCWTGDTAGLPAGIVPAIRPVKGQILRLRQDPQRPIVQRTVRARVHGQSVYLVPRADGEVVIGGTVEERGFDDTPTALAVHDMLRDARTVVPDVGECELVEHRVGFRPATPDNAPIISDTDIAGLVIAAGHFRNGVLLTPITADAVVDRLCDGRFPDYIKAFGHQRFAPSFPELVS